MHGPYFPVDGTTLMRVKDKFLGVLPTIVKLVTLPDGARANLSVPAPSEKSPKNAWSWSATNCIGSDLSRLTAR